MGQMEMAGKLRFLSNRKTFGQWCLERVRDVKPVQYGVIHCGVTTGCLLPLVTRDPTGRGLPSVSTGLSDYYFNVCVCSY